MTTEPIPLDEIKLEVTIENKYAEDEKYLAITRDSFINHLKSHYFNDFNIQNIIKTEFHDYGGLKTIYKNEQCSPELRSFASRQLNWNNIALWNHGLLSFINKCYWSACVYYHSQFADNEYRLNNLDNESRKNIINRLFQCAENGYIIPSCKTLYSLIDKSTNKDDRHKLADLVIHYIIDHPSDTWFFYKMLDLFLERIQSLSKQLAKLTNDKELIKRKKLFVTFDEIDMPAQIKSIVGLLEYYIPAASLECMKMEIHVLETIKNMLVDDTLSINVRIAAANSAINLYRNPHFNNRFRNRSHIQKAEEIITSMSDFIKEQAEQLNNPLAMIVYYKFLNYRRLGAVADNQQQWIMKSLELGCAQSFTEYVIIVTFSAEEYAMIAKYCVHYSHFFEKVLAHSGFNSRTSVQGFALYARQLQQRIEEETSLLPKTGSLYLKCEKEFEESLKGRHARNNNVAAHSDSNERYYFRYPRKLKEINKYKPY